MTMWVPQNSMVLLLPLLSIPNPSVISKALHGLTALCFSYCPPLSRGPAILVASQIRDVFPPRGLCRYWFLCLEFPFLTLYLAVFYSPIGVR